MSWLPKCLESCRPYPVIVVDNNSGDDTVTFIITHYPEITLLPQNKNLGFGQANNIGISHALKQGADFVFLLNQDAYLREECIAKLLEAHKNNDQYGILSPIHLNGRGDALDRNFSNYVRFDAIPGFYSDFVLGNSLSKIYEVPFVNAAGWLLARAILETVGGFDPIFFHYGEDDNYCQRARFHGYKIGVVPTTFLLHDREARLVPHFERGSKEYFVRMERSLKLKYANINIESIEELENLVKKRKMNILKAALKMNFSEVNYLNKEVKLLKKLIPEIQKSRKLNRQKIATYLNLI